MMKMNLGTKIGGGFASVLVIMLVLSGMAIWSMKSVGSQSTMLAEEYMPEVKVATSLQKSYGNYLQDMIYYATLAKDSYYESAEKNFELVLRDLEDAKTLANNSEHLVKLKDAVGTIEKNVLEYKSLADQTRRINGEINKNRQAMEAAAEKYLTACSDFLSSQNSQLKREISSGAGQGRLKERAFKINIINDIIDLGNDARVTAWKAQAQRDPEGLKQAAALFPQIGEKLDELRPVTRLEADIAQIDRTKQSADAYRNAILSYIDNWNQLNTLASSRTPLAFAIQDETIATADKGMEETSNIAQNAENSLSGASTTMIVGLLLALAIGVVLSIFITRMIIKPVTFITEGAKKLSLGDVELSGMDRSQITSINNRGDELGEIGKAFSGLIESQKAKAEAAEELANGNLSAKVDVASGEDVLGQSMVRMVESLRKVNTEVQELTRASLDGKLDARADASKHNGEYGKLVGGINELFDAIVQPIQEAADVLRSAADKDLTRRMEGRYKGQLDEFKNNINTTVNALDDALTQVAEAVEQVSAASGQISSGSQSLAQGANEQASSLEEVSSSLEEMASMTKQNADNANQANSLSNNARNSAEQGNQSMKRMSDAIEKIKKSSDDTAKIVKTIDEIAFQTNLLALNAAVEAARAGEAGKGFAVVAEEVRNLAQRSAEAAKNTANMIEEAVKNAEGGVEITEEVARALEEISNGSKQVNDLVAEIAAAASEQSQGIEQVNTAVSQMDQLTQQNASNSEESASAAEELNSQAEELQRMVSAFKLTNSVVKGSRRQPPASLDSSKVKIHSAAPSTTANRIKESVVVKEDSGNGKSGNGHSGKKTEPEKIIPLDSEDYGDF